MGEVADLAEVDRTQDPHPVVVPGDLPGHQADQEPAARVTACGHLIEESAGLERSIPAARTMRTAPVPIMPTKAGARRGLKRTDEEPHGQGELERHQVPGRTRLPR